MATTTPPGAAPDPLGEALHRLRMEGVFYSRAEVSEPWALEMPAIAESLSFHVITAGTCWLETSDGGRIELRTGDIALVPHGRGHVLVSEPSLRPAGRVDHLPQRYFSDHYSVLTYGGGGRESRLICGVVTFREPAARALMAALPAMIHIDGTGRTANAVHDTVRLMSDEFGDLRPGGEAVTTRLADVLVVQAIRNWLEHDPAVRTGWLGALQDERIGRSLAAVHRDPGAEWTLIRLAGEASMSRSSFAARFKDLVGEPAMAYVTRWRMTIAHDRLQDDGATLSGVATSLGYRSEAAFSRAFSRIIGQTPGSVRRATR